MPICSLDRLLVFSTSSTAEKISNAHLLRQMHGSCTVLSSSDNHQEFLAGLPLNLASQQVSIFIRHEGEKSCLEPCSTRTFVRDAERPMR
jgi:hypothetical protein